MAPVSLGVARQYAILKGCSCSVSIPEVIFKTCMHFTEQSGLHLHAIINVNESEKGKKNKNVSAEMSGCPAPGVSWIAGSCRGYHGQLVCVTYCPLATVRSKSPAFAPLPTLPLNSMASSSSVIPRADVRAVLTSVHFCLLY